jgi:two-component system chemotaxis response regulator CheY
LLLPGGEVAGGIMGSVECVISRRIVSLKVLIVDDEIEMRRVTRALLQSIGIRNIHEANDGFSGLEAICSINPDIILLDWEMPGPNGLDFVEIVRSPGQFPLPDVPIIMLTGSGERSRVVEAVRSGVNEYLLKPVSSTALLERIVYILAKPRRMVTLGNHYVPEPRKLSTYKPGYDPAFDEIMLSR